MSMCVCWEGCGCGRERRGARGEWTIGCVNVCVLGRLGMWEREEGGAGGVDNRVCQCVCVGKVGDVGGRGKGGRVDNRVCQCVCVGKVADVGGRGKGRGGWTIGCVNVCVLGRLRMWEGEEGGGGEWTIGCVNVCVCVGKVADVGESARCEVAIKIKED